MKVECEVSKVFIPVKNIYGSEKRPFMIEGIKSVKFENYSLHDQKASIEKYLNKPLPDFVTDSKGLSPTNIILTSDKMRVVADFGKLIRDDVNNSISALISKDERTGKTMLNISSVSYDGNVCNFS